MKKMLTVIGLLVFSFAGCTSFADGIKVVELSKDEKTQAQSIAERRQQIQFQRAAAQNDFQEKMNRFAEQEGGLNLESAKLCFQFKKNHRLEPNKNYMLDEWNGQLVKQ